MDELLLESSGDITSAEVTIFLNLHCVKFFVSMVPVDKDFSIPGPCDCYEFFILQGPGLFGLIPLVKKFSIPFIGKTNLLLPRK